MTRNLNRSVTDLIIMICFTTILLLVGTVGYLTHELLSLKEEFETFKSKVELNKSTIGENQKVIAGVAGAIFVIVLILYFSGISPGDLGSGLNSLGDQVLHNSKTAIGNLSDKLLVTHESQSQQITDLGTHLTKLEDSLANKFIVLSEQISQSKSDLKTGFLPEYSAARYETTATADATI